VSLRIGLSFLERMSTAGFAAFTAAAVETTAETVGTTDPADLSTVAAVKSTAGFAAFTVATAETRVETVEPRIRRTCPPSRR